MATLTGSTIADSYDQLLALPAGGINGATLVALTDGKVDGLLADHTFALKLSTGEVNSTGTLTAAGAATLSTSVTLATGATVTGIDNATLATGSATLLATQGAIKTYVDAQVGASDTLAEVLAIGNTTGSTNVIVTAGQSITTDTISETTAAAGVTIDSVLVKDNTVTATTFTGALTGNVTGDVTGNVTATSVLADGVVGTTQAASNNSTKVATTAYVDAQVGTSDTLSEVLANGGTATSSALAGVMSDETGSGSLVFATSPTLVTPALGTPASGVATNLTGTAASLTAGTVTTNANLTGDVTSSGNATTYNNVIPVAKGGTTLTGFTAGDILYADTTTTLAKLAKGSDTEVLTLASGVPSWAAPTTGDITGVTAGTNLNGGGTSGDVTLNLDTTITGLTSVTSTDFVGAVTGNVTGDVSGSSGSCTGNAATVTNGVYTTNNLSALAATTSAQLAGVISDETGSGALVFATSPTLVTPALGTPASGVLTNCTFPTLNQDTTGTAATVTGATQAAITSAANLVTVGTIGTGVWQGTAIDGTYVDIEGTEVKSTDEIGGTKFLREDGDGTCSWQTVSGGGGGVTSITPAADTGSGTAITGIGTLTNTGGTGIDTSVSGTTTTFDLDINELIDLTNTTFGDDNFGAGDHIAVADASTSNNPRRVKFPVELGMAVSDETTDLTTGTAKLTFRMPHAMTLTEVRANVNTAPTGSYIQVDINASASASSIFSTVLTIDMSEKTSKTADVPAVLSTTALADDAEFTVDIDIVGSSAAGKGLKIWLKGYR